MATIASFRGYRYNPSEIDDLNKVVTQPYDKIDDALQQDYHARSPYNVTRIIKGNPTDQDTRNDNVYTRAAHCWEEWIENRILIREAGPAIYPYHQEYTVDGQTFVRKGFIALIGLDDENLKVRAHEKTLTGPKADRLKLMRATEANDGQIFMLYDDPMQKVNELLEPEVANAKPIMEVKDDYDAIHRLYRVTRPGLIRDIAEIFDRLELFIADGHHRYETAVNYMKECKERNWEAVDAETFSYRMMTMVSMQDPGLTVLPTHRVLHSLDNFDPDDFLSRAAEKFDIQEISDREGLYSALDEAGKTGNASFGFSAVGMDGYRLLTLKDTATTEGIIEGEHSATWRGLDVTVLHFAILDAYLGINEEKLAAGSNVHYFRRKDGALDAVGDGTYQAAFLINPTRLEQVREVALAGERMPQKSTDFFPKLLTGMVMMKMKNDKSMGLATWEADG